MLGVGLLAADSEVVEPSLPSKAESTEAATDGTGRDALCEPTMLTERSEVGSADGNCLRIRVRSVDDACGVTPDTLLTVLVPI